MSCSYPAKVSNALTGDRTLLPQSALHQLLADFGVNNLPSPLTFALNFKGNIAYASVKEFSADNGMIHISPGLAKLLQLTDMTDQHISVAFQSLPKAEYLKLNQLSLHNLDDARSTLEAFLRQNYTTLTRGDTLAVTTQSIQGISFLHEFLVAELKPENGCLISDTDITVDIVPLLQNVPSITTNPELIIKQLGWFGKDESYIEESGHLASNSQIYLKIAIKPSIKYEISLALLDNEDCDLILSGTRECPSLLDHDAFNVEYGDKSIQWINDSNHPFLYLCIQALDKGTKFELNIHILSESQETMKDASSLVDILPANSTQCDNCKAWIQQSQFPIHSAFCFRNNIRCPYCHDIIKKSESDQHWHCEVCANSIPRPLSHREKHMSRIHNPITCECKDQFFIADIGLHRCTQCVDRMIVCRFCHLLCKAGLASRSGKDLILGGGITEHESDRGARTIECAKCRKKVQLKDVQVHMNGHLQTERIENRKPPLFILCANVECSDMAETDRIKANFLHLCPRCFAPYWSSREDPGFQKLARKLLTRMHCQLTTGCQYATCYKYCCTNPEYKDSRQGKLMNGTEAAILSAELIQQTVFAGRTHPIYHLCVPVDVAERTRILRTLETTGYTRAWCVKAMLASGNDPEKASSWLIKYAGK